MNLNKIEEEKEHLAIIEPKLKKTKTKAIEIELRIQKLEIKAEEYESLKEKLEDQILDEKNKEKINQLQIGNI